MVLIAFNRLRTRFDFGILEKYSEVSGVTLYRLLQSRFQRYRINTSRIVQILIHKDVVMVEH